MATRSALLDQLVAELRSVPPAALPAIAASVRSARLRKKSTSKSGKGASPDQIAELVLALPKGKGSKLREVERAVVLHALEACAGNVSAAARLLGVDRKAMERRVAKARAGSKRRSAR